MAILLKLLMSLAGMVLMAFGVVLAPLPGPVGVPFVLFGLILLLRSSTWIKRQFMKQVRAHPRWLRPLRAMLRPGAKVISLVWLQGLRVERGLMPRRFRFMQSSRQGVKQGVKSIFKNRLPRASEDAA
jgi:hypothetical protein